MSDLMDRAVIGMPFDMAMRSHLSRLQFYNRAQAILAERDALLAERDAAFAAGLQSAVTICKRVRSEVAENEAEATGALECAIAIMDEVNALAAKPRP